MKAVLAKTTGALNTPRTAQVDELFRKVIGLDRLSSSLELEGKIRGSILLRYRCIGHAPGSDRASRQRSKECQAEGR